MFTSLSNVEIKNCESVLFDKRKKKELQNRGRRRTKECNGLANDVNNKYLSFVFSDYILDAINGTGTSKTKNHCIHVYSYRL